MMRFRRQVSVDSFSLRDKCGYDVCRNVRSACTVFQNSGLTETDSDADRVFLDDRFLLKIFDSAIFVYSSNSIVDSDAGAECDCAGCFFLSVEPDHVREIQGCEDVAVIDEEC